MLSNVYQLEPTGDTFYNFIFQKLKAIDIVIICEGTIDKKVVKKIMSISEINTNVKVGIINAGGIDLAYDIATIIASLANIARKLKYIGVLIDAESFTIDERVVSLLNSLRSHGLVIRTPSHVEGQIYKVTIGTAHGRSIDLVIAVSGDFDLPFKTHKLEDHGVRLLLMEGIISKEEVENSRDAKELVSEERLLDLLESSQVDNIKLAFRHIYTLLKMLGVLSASS